MMRAALLILGLLWPALALAQTCPQVPVSGEAGYPCPIVQTPASSLRAANKGYVDAQIAQSAAQASAAVSSALSAKLSITGDASATSVTSPLTGGVAAALVDRLTTLSGRDFGAVPNTGLDMTAALNTALQRSFESRKTLVLEKGYYGVSQSGVATDGRPYALFNQAVSVEGLGTNATDTVIYPLSGMASNVDILRVDVPANAGEHWNLRNLTIDPAASGAKLGNVGLYLVNEPGANVSKVLIENFRVKPGNNYSFVAVSTPASNNQSGVLANSQIRRSQFDDGVQMLGAGDSITWSSVVFRNTSTARAALDYTVTNYNPSYPSGIANLASMQVFDNCNFGAVGPIAVLHNGRHYVFRNPNAEIGNTSGATGGPNGAMIDVRGDVGPIVRVEILGGHLGLFGDGTATTFLRFDNVQNAFIDGPTLALGLPATGVGIGILTTANALATNIRGFRDQNRSSFASLVSDSGQGTMGLIKPATLASGWTNVGGGYESAGFLKTEDGTVHLSGLVAGGSSAGSTAIFTLPVGFRPLTAKNIGVALRTGGTTTLDLFTDGRVFFNGSSSSQVSLTGITFQVDPVIDEISQAH